MDINFVHEAMEEPLLRGFLTKLQRTEIVPTVGPVPETNLEGYSKLIERRFANPSIRDTIGRLCYDGSNRQPKFILPSAADRMKNGQPVIGLALVAAFWCRYCYGETDSGSPIPPNDPDWGRLQAQAKRARTHPRLWLEMTDLFGETGRNAGYVAAFSTALESIWAKGTRETLAGYLKGDL
jgi:mannitol 2-dehydrogenase